MPALIDSGDDLAAAVQQITLSASDTDYVDQLVPVLKDVRYSDRAGQLVQALNQFASEREADIERMCNSNHQEFISSINQLLSVRQGSVDLTAEILELNQSIQKSTENLAGQKKSLVEARGVRQNINDTTEALNACLEVLRLANQVHDLLGKKNHYAALRALDELQNVHLREVSRYKIAELIEKSVPATQKLIAEAVMSDLNTWLYRIREASQYLGEVSFFQTEMRRARQRERADNDDYFTRFKLNSAVELVADENDELDILDSEENQIHVDFSPLFECLHIHETLGRREVFQTEYAATRRRQKELLIPSSINLLEEEDADLSRILEDIAGFAIIERATMNRTDSLRSNADVEELWDSMCHSAVTLISGALHTVDSDEKLLQIKGRISLFMQTMSHWRYSTSSFDALMLSLFNKYAEVLKRRFSEDFLEIVSTDDYMPMRINNPEEYDKVVSVSWYSPETAFEELAFPCVFPFSQMYPLCCIDIRNFLNQIYLFSDDHFERSSVIDDTLKSSLDTLLCQDVCASLVERLRSQYPGQIVQILTNLSHFETACHDLSELLFQARHSSSAVGPVVLQATTQFQKGRQQAEQRIFELVKSKIDDLVDNADYNFDLVSPPSRQGGVRQVVGAGGTHSGFIVDLRGYLDLSFNSTLVGLAPVLREELYTDCIIHTANQLLELIISPSVHRLSRGVIDQFAADVAYFVEFVQQLQMPSMAQNLEELTQVVALLTSNNGEEEFFDVASRNRRYGKVDPQQGAELLEKVYRGRALG
ncbi:exocyst complex subunit Sec15-like protein [Patellaria atrata CBS 101060]|uniref:Exocyst complex component SEC15 n=1 Tax=Patellaria atrata CBS 101060 TaxID=1346257 RepID=A0A9P4SFH2_9PEZI|nr:exocyst complex subunit Sec15-like protein [Patellaria atrata CBS 101060]